MPALRPRLFRLVHDASTALRRRLTPAGRVLAGAAGVAGALGVDTRQSHAAMLFTLGVALLLAALPFAALFRPRIEAMRRLPAHATAGRPFAYTLELRNHSRRTLRDLSAQEELAARPAGAAEWRARRARGRAGANWLDRAMGYPDWVALTRERQGAQIPAVPVPPLPPGGLARVTVQARPLRRGVLRFAGTRIARPDPLGLVNGLLRTGRPGDLVVLPARYPCAPPPLAGGRRAQPGGVALAGPVGDAQEVMSVRDYRPGDPLRRIHWRSWARTGRPIVKELQDEYFVRQALVLDMATEPGERFEAMVSVAASHLEPLAGPDALVDLFLLGVQATRLTSGRGLGSQEGLLAALASVQAAPAADPSAPRGALAHAAQGLSGAICVLADWDDPRRALVDALRGQGVTVAALVVSDAPDARPGPLAPGVRRVRAGHLAQDLAP